MHPIHPAALAMPQMSADDYNALREDIARNGQLLPIELLDGQVIDGRHRQMACEELGIQPECVEIELDGHTPASYVWSLNRCRRHMTTAQKVAIGVDFMPVEEAAAKDRQRGSGGDRKSGAAKSVTEKIPEPKGGEAREKVAEMVGVNPRYIQDGKKIKAESPETFEKMRAGKITMQDAKAEASRAAAAKTSECDWPEIERAMKEQVEFGLCVVACMSRHKHLIAWAESCGRFRRIDRATEWGNPFRIGDDGDRDEVIRKFAKYYWPHKTKLQAELPDLAGCVLGCHCAPEPCHGDVIARACNAL
jgi:hypothetical protein